MYTLTGKNSFIRDEDGTNIPFDIGNFDYTQAVSALLIAGCLTVDNNNNITSLTPDENLLKSIPQPSQPSLTDLRNAAKKAIDDAAGAARARYITVTPGQDATYLAKAQDADKFKIANYLPEDATGFLWVQAETAAMGGDTTAQEAADSILTQRDQWYQLGSAIERVRIGGKLDIDTRIKDTTIVTSRDNTIALLNTI